MRKLHRKIGIFFAPFLAVSAVTGLLWAYAPYLYLKNDASKKIQSPAIDEKRSYLPIANVIEAAQAKGAARISSITLKAQSGRLVYIVYGSSKQGQKELWVDAESGAVEVPARTRAQEFHSWIMKMHRFEYFGTKKELTAFSGVGLLLMIGTGLVLWRKKT